ncbi:MAG TPA: FkbM family methyltransferase [Dongiaceae bacterium]|nr:FkbM family methyltransferase [Dongiaceae bacterium]
MDGLLLSMLKMRRRKFINRFPQVVCFAFDHISTEIAVRGRFERAELEFLSSQIFSRMRSRRVCLDVGANIGNHSLTFAEHFARVLAFEPNPRTFKLLAINAELARNVVPYRLGASNRKGTITAYQDALNLGATTTDRGIAEYRAQNQGVISTVQFDVDRLDCVLSGPDLHQVDFIKLDVEGQEAAALEGMEAILQVSDPIVAMEALVEIFEDGKLPPVEILKAHGYTHFYSLEGARRDIAGLPRFIGKPYKRVRKLLGSGGEQYALKKLDTVMPRYHRMLICSKREVI